MGELMDVLNPALSASPRPWHEVDTDQPALTEAGVYRNNETLFLLHLLPYQVLHAGRAIMERATGQGWSLRRFSEHLLRVAARVVSKSRRLTFVIAFSADGDWSRFRRKLQRYRWSLGYLGSAIALRRGRARADCIQTKATASHSRTNRARSLTRNRNVSTTRAHSQIRQTLSKYCGKAWSDE